MICRDAHLIVSARKSYLDAAQGLLSAALVILFATLVFAGPWDDVLDAREAYYRGQNSKAVELTTRAIKSGQLQGIKLARAYAIRALARNNLNRNDDAKDDNTRAIGVIDKLIGSGAVSGPALADAYFLRAVSKYKLERKSEAIQDYTIAIRLDKDHWKARLNRAGVYTELRQYDLAIADYRAIVAAQSSTARAFAGAYGNWAQLLVKRGDYEEAIQKVTRAIDTDPEAPGMWQYFSFRGDARFLNGDHAGAIADYEKSLKFNSGFEFAKHKIARARAAMKRAAEPGYISDAELWSGLGLEQTDRKTGP